jgi:hypothetical protein
MTEESFERIKCLYVPLEDLVVALRELVTERIVMLSKSNISNDRKDVLIHNCLTFYSEIMFVLKLQKRNQE